MDELAAAQPEALWHEASRRLEAELGLHYPPAQWREMQRGLQAAAARLGLADARACAEQLLLGQIDPQGLRTLAQCLAIGETYFFRDPAFFSQLASTVLEPLVRVRRAAGDRQLRLWCAGCSTGEEPYSVAMLLARLLPDWREWNLSVLGTDLNTASLDKARAGIYGRWSLREGMPEAARPFLTPLPDGRHEVAPEIRRLVRFEALNLAHDAGPDAALGATRLDVVLCRNVLIYFKAARARRVLARLAAALGPQGWLITNPVEIPAGGIEGMRLVHVGALVGLQRAAVGDAAMPAATAGTPAPPTRVRATRGTHPAALARTRATPAQAPQPAAPAPSQAAPAGAPDDLQTGQIRARADAGHLDQAEALCREAIARDKLNPEWTYLLSTILAERGATEEAAAALQRTLYLDRGHVLARFCLGGILLRGGETEAGLRQFAMALSQLAGLPPEQVIPGSGGLMVRELRAAIEQARSALEPR